MFRQVLDGSQEQIGAVAESAKASITVRTQQGSDFPGSVAVIDGEVYGAALSFAAGRFAANGANTVLLGKNSIIVFESDSVIEDKAMVSIFVGVRKLVIEGMIHIGKMGINWLKFSGAAMGSRVFVTGSEVEEHAIKCESSPAVATWFKFPATGAGLDSTEISPIDAIGMFVAPLVKSCKRTWLAFVVKSVNTGGVFGKFSSQFRLLTSRTKSLFWCKFRKAIAQLPPMSAESFWGGFFTAKTAFDVGFTDHDLIVS